MSSQQPAPYRFAKDVAVNLNLDNSGSWENFSDGSRIWRLPIDSNGAQTLNLRFNRFDLPEGAKLWIYNTSGDYVEGPYMAKHRAADGGLWTPVIPGEEIIIELYEPDDVSGQSVVEIGRVNHGYRGFEGSNKVGGDKAHGACNIDAICPQGDSFRDQIRSVARYTRDGTFLCTGQLLNNTTEVFTPYFLTAFHCGINPDNAESMVFYWNYESPTCGQQSGGDFSNNQTGATYLASWEDSDFALVQLSRQPDSDFNVHYTGWDATGDTPGTAVGIHHPSGDVKSISFR